MEPSLIVAKILGIYLTLSGLFLIFRGKTVPHLMQDFFDHPAMVYLTGMILIFLSSLYLLQNNIWDGSWRSVVTAFAWMVLIKGALYILAPEKLKGLLSKKMFDAVSLFGVVALAGGIFLFYIA